MKTKITRDLLVNIVPKQNSFDIIDTEIKGFIARVYPSGSVMFSIRYSDKFGKQSRYSLNLSFPVCSVTEARKAAITALARVVAGDDLLAERRKPEKPELVTLNSFIDDHYASWQITNRKSGKAAINRIKTSFKRFLNYPLGGFNAKIFEDFKVKKLKAGASNATVNRDIATLRTAFSKAVDWDFIADHPMRRVKMLKEPSGKVRWLSDEEESRLREALDAREADERAARDSANLWRNERKYDLLPDLKALSFVDHLKPMVILSINTGIRRGEMFSLKWSSIDLERGNLTVEDHAAKSGKTRHVPLNKEALDILRLWRKQVSGDYVFPGKEGKPITDIKKSFLALLNRAEIDNFRWHDFRHHFASRLVMAGVDLNTVRELLGHSDLKMTLRYAHLAPEHKAAAVEKLVRG